MAITDYAIIPKADYIAACDKIREHSGKTDAIKSGDLAAEIEVIAGSGGSVEGVHFVTFKNEDGAKELYKRPVADGDNCADIVVRGLIDKPTKEMTDAEVYTYSGWSMTSGGAASSSALENVTEDRTVYAAFTATARTYAARFYDDAGALMQESQVAYGTQATPPDTTKKGYSFAGWTPSDLTIYGDTDFVGKWAELINFSGGAWSDIVDVCESGNAANVFNVGDTRTVVNGDYSLTFRIIGIDFDNLADGSGKAGITIGVTNSDGTPVMSKYIGASTWQYSTLRTTDASAFAAMLPSEVTESVKQITKNTVTQPKGPYEYSMQTTEDTYFIPSREEVSGYSGTASMSEGLGIYEGLDTSEERKICSVDWWTRSHAGNSGVAFVQSANGLVNVSAGTNTKGLLWCFCI